MAQRVGNGSKRPPRSEARPHPGKGTLKILVGAAIVIVASIVVMRGCANKSTTEADRPAEVLLTTLATRDGVDITPALADASAGTLQTRAWTYLHQGELYGWLAGHAVRYDELDGLPPYESYNALALSTRSPQAVYFSRHLADRRQASLPFRGTVANGAVPALYQWDERWGYVSYCGHPLGFTGCGVTVAAMARMALTGKTDMTPADMAELAVRAGEANGGTNSTFFTNGSVSAVTGVRGTRLADTTSALTGTLRSGGIVAVSVRANTLAGGGHWVLARDIDADGKVRINDPNSPNNTAKAWDPIELVDISQAMIQLTAA